MKKFFILFSAVALICAFTVPATAGDWSFYGSARMATFYSDADEEAGNDADTSWAMQGNSRIGANVKGGDISGRFEYGTGVNTRILYGSWNFGGGSLLLGQTYSPVNIFISNQVYGGDSDMLNVGGVYGGRQQMIRLSTGGFNVALVNPSTSNLTGGDVDTTLPKVELSYSFSAGPASLAFVGGYNTYTIENALGDVDINSYVAGLKVGLNFGPAYVNMNAYTGVNTGPYGLWQEGNADPAIVTTIDSIDVEDTTTVGLLGIVGFKASPELTFEGGAGYLVHSNDSEGLVDDDTMAAYLQAVVTVAPGFFIVPEVGFYDYGEGCTGMDEGTMTYFGAKWQINF